jgi:hypothetical protein
MLDSGSAADQRGLRLIGFGLGAITAAVLVMATLTVAGVDRGASEPPLTKVSAASVGS